MLSNLRLRLRLVKVSFSVAWISSLSSQVRIGVSVDVFVKQKYLGDSVELKADFAYTHSSLQYEGMFSSNLTLLYSTLLIFLLLQQK